MLAVIRLHVFFCFYVRKDIHSFANLLAANSAAGSEWIGNHLVEASGHCNYSLCAKLSKTVKANFEDQVVQRGTKGGDELVQRFPTAGRYGKLGQGLGIFVCNFISVVLF